MLLYCLNCKGVNSPLEFYAIVTSGNGTYVLLQNNVIHIVVYLAHNCLLDFICVALNAALQAYKYKLKCGMCVFKLKLFELLHFALTK